MFAFKTHCNNCALSSLCLPVGLNEDEQKALTNIIHTNKTVRKGDYLFKQNDKLDSIYMVKTGAIKAFYINKAGYEKIYDFYLPSELVGLSAIANHQHSFSAQAMENASVCIISYKSLNKLSMKISSLQDKLLAIMSCNIEQGYNMSLLLSQKSSDERLALFLLQLSNRFALRGFSPKQFRISMSRREIGNYLGLAVETVSRAFVRLADLNLIKVSGKEIEILDLAKLQALTEEENILKVV